MLADTYEELLASVPERAVEMVLGRLREFHAFLQSAHGVAAVEWAEVVPEHAHTNFSPDAAFVTEFQYAHALSLLASDPDSDMRERAAHVAALVLMYRFGLRIGEVLGLRRGDLIKNEADRVALWIVLVRPNQHRQIKSAAGIRQVPLLEELGPVEAEALDQWALHAGQQAAQDRISALFNAEGRPRDLLDRTQFTARLKAALVTATGRPDARLHHLRHSYATRMTLLLSIDDADEVRKLPVIARLCGSGTPSRVQDRLLGRRGVDSRALWALANLLGHASPRTTLRWYSHAAETLAAALAPQAHRQIDVTLSAQEKRYWEDVHNVAQDGSEPGNPRRIRMLEPKALSAPLPHRPRPAVEPMTLETLDGILDAAYRTGSVLRVSQMVMRPLVEVERILGLDYRIRSIAGYDLPAGRWAPTTATTVHYGRMGSRRAHESQRLRPWWKTAHTLLLQPVNRELAEAACAVWQRRFRPSSTPLILASAEEVNDLRRWLVVCGVEEVDMMVTTDLQGDDAAMTAWEGAGITSRGVEWLSNARVAHRGVVSGRVGFQMKRNREGAIPTTAALHRVLHCLSVWLAYVNWKQ